MIRTTNIGLLLLALLALPTVAGGEDAKPVNWAKLRKTAEGLFEWNGGLKRKEKVVDRIAGDNSERAADLLVTWSVASAKHRKKVLLPGQKEAHEKYDKHVQVLQKTYPGESIPPKRWTSSEHKAGWQQVRNVRDDWDAYVQSEHGLQKRIGDGLRSMADEPAVRWLATEGLKRLKKVDVQPARLGLALGLLESKLPDVLPTALKMAHPKGNPRTVLELLNWLGEQRPPEGFDVMVKALKATHPAVQRAAVFGLRNYNDLRAIKPLIDALPRTRGLISEEIEDVLHWYTGQSFNAEGSIWKRWWKDAGEAWVAKGEAKRHPPRGASHSSTGTSFYNIPTASHRIVFVLDRSGSMKTEAGAQARKKKEEQPPPDADERKKSKKKKGPVGHADGPVAGDTKMEVAKNQLARSIRGLSADVHFNLVFYSSRVKAWQPPPKLLPATAANKKAAIAWFMELEPAGNTALFDALHKALEYADAATSGKRGNKIEGGADTIFLLSDGSPTGSDSKALTRDVIEQRVKAFQRANAQTRCVVHTIGIGPRHMRWLMQRIASESGGEYRAVGAR